jgi:GT2 family glycosyltransferase
MTDWDHTTNRDDDQVNGAFFLIRRDLFERLGGFDERFFVYFEEVDLARRAAELGYRSHYLATARAFHRGGGCTDQVKARRLTYSIRSRLAYASKHFSRVSATTLALATILIEPISRIIACALRGSVTGCAETVRGFRPVWKEAPGILGRMLGTRPR